MEVNDQGDVNDKSTDIEFQSGRTNFTLFDDVVPKTAENFARLYDSQNPCQDTYSGIAFYRAVLDFCFQGGDVTRQNVRNQLVHLVPSWKFPEINADLFGRAGDWW